MCFLSASSCPERAPSTKGGCQFFMPITGIGIGFAPCCCSSCSTVAGSGFVSYGLPVSGSMPTRSSSMRTTTSQRSDGNGFWSTVVGDGTGESTDISKLSRAESAIFSMHRSRARSNRSRRASSSPARWASRAAVTNKSGFASSPMNWSTSRLPATRAARRRSSGGWRRRTVSCIAGSRNPHSSTPLRRSTNRSHRKPTLAANCSRVTVCPSSRATVCSSGMGTVSSLYATAATTRITMRSSAVTASYSRSSRPQMPGSRSNHDVAARSSLDCSDTYMTPSAAGCPTSGTSLPSLRSFDAFCTDALKCAHVASMHPGLPPLFRCSASAHPAPLRHAAVAFHSASHSLSFIGRSVASGTCGLRSAVRRASASGSPNSGVCATAQYT
mmetsp:Transcript_16448/g.51033  ORF Transcript_16448/g.51033 Transcript_16448/m.51033 type:complete len:385 (-) Transcript_16448:242-1396(-)